MQEQHWGGGLEATTYILTLIAEISISRTVKKDITTVHYFIQPVLLYLLENEAMSLTYL